MKITAIETTVVYGRWKRQFGAVVTALGSKGIIEGVSENVVVQIRTDKGITGLGEISTVFNPRGAVLAKTVESVITPALTGEDPRRIAHLVKRMDTILPGFEQAKAGVEMALWDILGKEADMPLYALLGGKVRDLSATTTASTSACKACAGTPMVCTTRMPARTRLLAKSVAPVKSSAMQPNFKPMASPVNTTFEGRA